MLRLVKDRDFRSPLKHDNRVIVDGVHDLCGNPPWQNQHPDDEEGTCGCCHICLDPHGH